MVKIYCKGQIVIYNFTIVQLIRSKKDVTMIIRIIIMIMPMIMNKDYDADCTLVPSEKQVRGTFPTQ